MVSGEPRTPKLDFRDQSSARSPAGATSTSGEKQYTVQYSRDKGDSLHALGNLGHVCKGP